jgi:lysophospholipase L1-like esterase
MKTCVKSAGINDIGQAKLPYPPEPLKIRMVDQIVEQIRRDRYKPVDRIVNNFPFIQNRFFGKSNKQPTDKRS